jgi:hypothetical protein
VARSDCALPPPPKPDGERHDAPSERAPGDRDVAMRHSGARHGQGVAQEGGEGREGEAFQGAREEERGGEEMWEECGDGVELRRGERLTRRLGGQSRRADPVDGASEGGAPNAGERQHEADQWARRGGQDTRPPMHPTRHPHPPQLRVTLRGRHRQDLRHPRQPGADGPQHPARCSLHEDHERGAAFSDLLYYAILVILESSHFSSDLLCCLDAIVIVNSK